MSNCGCNSHSHPHHRSQSISICDPCNTNTGCAIQLDYECIIYHKSNNQISNLTCLGLTNGATLNQFAEAVDAYICQIKAPDYVLPCLRQDYTINTLKQFAEAVDVELCQIKTDLDTISDLVNLPITPVDSTSINLAVSGTNDHTLTGNIIVSPAANNLLTILSDGVYSAPQILEIDYTDKTLTISNGNTVDLSGLSCGVGGFIGNVTSNPGASLDGQYWFRTDLPAADGLKIKVNGVVRTIPTT